MANNQLRNEPAPRRCGSAASAREKNEARDIGRVFGVPETAKAVVIDAIDVMVIEGGEGLRVALGTSNLSGLVQ
jgi:hypothetical protein